MTTFTNYNLDPSHFESVSEISNNANGIIIKAMEKRQNRDVAIKIFPFMRGISDELLQDFNRSILKWSSINHTGVCQIYECLKIQESPACVMEIVEGFSLTYLLEHGIEFKDSEIKDILRNFSDIITTLCAAGVFELGFVPQKLIRERSGKFKLLPLIDSTKYKIRSRIFTAIEIPNGPQYIPPECYNGGAFNEGSYIYILGVILYELLLGAPILGTAKFAESAKFIRFTSFEADINLLPVEKRKYQEILNRSYTRHAHKRFANIHEMQKAISNV